MANIYPDDPSKRRSPNVSERYPPSVKLKRDENHAGLPAVPRTDFLALGFRLHVGFRLIRPTTFESFDILDISRAHSSIVATCLVSPDERVKIRNLFQMIDVGLEEGAL